MAWYRRCWKRACPRQPCRAIYPKTPYGSQSLGSHSIHQFPYPEFNRANRPGTSALAPCIYPVIMPRISIGSEQRHCQHGNQHQQHAARGVMAARHAAVIIAHYQRFGAEHRLARKPISTDPSSSKPVGRQDRRSRQFGALPSNATPWSIMKLCNTQDDGQRTAGKVEPVVGKPNRKPNGTTAGA